MDQLSGWEIGAALLTAGTAVGALVLGIRAERRASRYEPHFEIKEDFQSGWVSVINRTGETAVNVSLTIKVVSTPATIGESRSVVLDGERAAWPFDREEWHAGMAPPVVLTWQRERTRQSYAQQDYRQDDRSMRERVADGIRGSQPGFRRPKPTGRKIRQR